MTTPEANPQISPPASAKSPLPWLALAAALVVLGAIGAAFFGFRLPGTHDVTIGVEGRRLVEISGPQLSAAQFTPGDALAVRIASVQPTPGGFRYDVRYMAFGPGTHDIGQALRRPDGTSPEARSEFSVSVAALIPEKYSGELYTTPSSAIDLHSNHALWMSLAWGAWGVLLLPLIWLTRKKRRRTARPVREPTVAERLRALLEQAARQNLTIAEQADLEQLLLAFWSQRLKLSPDRLSEAIAELRRHPQAGSQWDRVERWLHTRSPSTNGAAAKELLRDIAALK
jgi:hypothetical protein